jgi:hypothetical protein
MTLFVIEDEAHAEWIGEFLTMDDAWGELRRLSAIAWDQEPNRAPCRGWTTCGRDYVLIEFDDLANPWREIRRMSAMKVSAKGVAWEIPHHGWGS